MNINSKYYEDKIENTIVQLVKTIAIENKITIDDAKKIARSKIQIWLNVLMSEEEKQLAIKVKNIVIARIKDDYHNILSDSDIYKLLSIMEL